MLCWQRDSQLFHYDKREGKLSKLPDPCSFDFFIVSFASKETIVWPHYVSSRSLNSGRVFLLSAHRFANQFNLIILLRPGEEKCPIQGHVVHFNSVNMRNSTVWCLLVMDWIVPSQNSYVEALISNLTVFGDRALRKKLKLNEVMG